MSGRRDPKTVTRYDHGRENLEQNAINYLHYDGDSQQNLKDGSDSDSHDLQRRT